MMSGFRARVLSGLAVCFLVLFATLPSQAAQTLPPVRHVFIIMLENEGARITFKPHSAAPYLAQTLRKRGAYLAEYYATGHYSLDNYIAMISGQGPNHVTQNDCPDFADFKMSGNDPDGQAIGEGCVYPSSVQNLADQLSAKGFTWKSYAEDMGNDPTRESAACGHPELNQPDKTHKAQGASPGHPVDQYATRHNPFMYFHAVIDSPACNANVVRLEKLSDDLKSAATTPNLAYIVPNLCHDGHDGVGKKPCVDGEPGNLVSANLFLKKLVPQILSSPAYRQDGLIIITFDEADIDVDRDASGKYVLESGDASACCGEVMGPNIKPDQTVFGIPDQGPGVLGPGGGRIGAVMLSPFIKPGTVSNEPYNHYSLLRTLEDMFGLPYLGYAGKANSMGADVFTRPQK
jgi:phospholipase C